MPKRESKYRAFVVWFGNDVDDQYLVKLLFVKYALLIDELKRCSSLIDWIS